VQLHAPMDAYVTAVNGNVGKYFSPTDILFELVNINNTHLTLGVFEKDLHAFQIGQKVVAFNQANPDGRYQARIVYMSQQVGTDRSVEVHCQFDHPVRDLKPGMYMTAEVETGNHQELTVPNEAIVRFDNKHYVFAAVSDTVFDMIEVVPGVSENGFSSFQTVSGNSVSQTKLVLKNAYTLLMKLKNAEE
ncbi:MAG: efflux RND transporter periplasmic adaptor subunit, partial [Saprospiraceae bacterium]|nr:efflux RND transporter periplasmic adaptor subunit [Saprospiraceae bacterium]